LKPIQEKELLDARQIESLFSNVDVILNTNKILLKKLQQRSLESSNEFSLMSIGDVFLEVVRIIHNLLKLITLILG
jgi:hypothetical protein